MGRDDCAGVKLCPSAAWHVVCNDAAQILGDSDGQVRENPFFRTVWGAILGPMRLNFLSVYGESRFKFVEPVLACGIGPQPCQRAQKCGAGSVNNPLRPLRTPATFFELNKRAAVMTGSYRFFRFLAGAALALGVVSHAMAQQPFVQFTLEGPGVAKHTATFDVSGWNGTKHSATGASALQGAVSREGRRYGQVSLELSGDTPYLILSLFEDGRPTEGAGSNSMGMRSKAGDGVDAFLKVTPAINEKKRATGTFSGVLVVTNRRSKSAAERTYQLSNGKYSLTALKK